MGYCIELLTTPQQTHQLVMVFPKDQEPLIIQEEITKLCQKGAVIPVDRVDSRSTGFCSTIFMVPKKDTKQMRLVVNLKPLNREVSNFFEVSSPTKLPRLHHSNPLVAIGQRGPGVMAPRGLRMEREESAAHSSRVGDRDRRVPSGMGSLLPRNSHGWQMVRGGGTPAYQRAGVASSPALSESIPEACQGCRRVTKE